MGEGSLGAGGLDEVVLARPFPGEKHAHPRSAGNVVGRRGRGFQVCPVAKSIQRFPRGSVHVAVRFRIFPECDPVPGKGFEIEVTFLSEGSQEHHRLVAVVGEVASSLARMVGTRRIVVFPDRGKGLGDFVLAVDPVGAQREGVRDQ